MSRSKPIFSFLHVRPIRRPAESKPASAPAPALEEKPGRSTVLKERQKKRKEELLRKANEKMCEIEVINQVIEDIKLSDKRVNEQRMKSERPLSAPARMPITFEEKAETNIQEETKQQSPPAMAAASPGAVVLKEPTIQTIKIPKLKPWPFNEELSPLLNPRTQIALTGRDWLLKNKPELEDLEVPEVLARLESKKYHLAADFLKQHKRYLHLIKGTPVFNFLLETAPIPFFTFKSTTEEKTPGLPKKSLLEFSHEFTQPNPNVCILGIGDLLTVEEKLLRYVDGEVAHIENVMQSEQRSRLHKRTREVEEIIQIETETEKEEERDLQSTDRFEMQKETEKTIEQEMNIESGVSVTGHYGMTSIEAEADFGLVKSASEVTNTASRVAKEITEKTIKRIKEKVREERTHRTMERIEEENKHAFNNAGDGHITGIYRWVDKEYEAQLINHGRRLMLQFNVPEPAAFYRHLTNPKNVSGVVDAAEEALKPTVNGRPLKPQDLLRDNYRDFVAKYNVTNVDPYPSEYIEIGAAAAEVVSPSAGNVLSSKKYDLTIPDHYRVYGIYGVAGYNYDATGSRRFINIFIAGRRWDFGSLDFSNINLVGQIPMSVSGYFHSYQINMMMQCWLTDEARAKWQLDTYEKIMQGYENALANHREKVAREKIQAGVSIQGHNPKLNRKIEREELQKAVLKMVAADDSFYEEFNAMHDNGENGYPDFDMTEVQKESEIVQFFQQAFEWSDMVYKFYPYFWGRQEKWDDIFPLDDTDPRFADFLRAGYARVIVPVRPAYNAAMQYYLKTGQIFMGRNPPTIGDPLFVAITDELKEDADPDVKEDVKSLGTWTYTVPTTLVHLQQSPELPVFASAQSDASGSQQQQPIHASNDLDIEEKHEEKHAKEQSVSALMRKQRAQDGMMGVAKQAGTLAKNAAATAPKEFGVGEASKAAVSGCWSCFR